MDFQAYNIALGGVPNWSLIHKFGDNPDVDDPGIEDIWNFGGSYTYSTTADIDTISSSNAGDGQVVQVQGLDGDYNLVVQNATLNGQTKVTLATPLLRVFRLKNLGATDNAGNIYVYVDGDITAGEPDTDADVRAYCAIGDNQTLMAIFTIPAGRQGLMTSWYAALSRRSATAATITMRRRSVGGVFQVKEIVAINSTGTGYFKREYEVPELISEKTDIVIQAEVSADNTGVSAGFDIVLIDVA